jgi:HlyD family secretion protein
MIEQPTEHALLSIRRHLMVGAGALVVLIAGLGGWAVTTELSGAVIGSGFLVVDSNVKKVQHPTGGVVGELRVRDGDRVKEGAIVVRLDETVTRANLAIVSKSLDEFAVRQARLEAERDGADAIEFPEALTARSTEAELGRVVDGERKLFEFRKTARQGQKAQLKERIAQLGEEIQGLSGQAGAKKREIELINRELDGVRDLWQKNLIPLSRLTALEREAVRLDGERNQLIASAAQAKGKTTETELQIIQIEQDLRSEVSKELREIQGKTAESVERKIAAEDQLKRIDIRAPQDGVVHQLAVHTVGGVISASEPLMLIVPENDALTVEAKVAPQDIDQLHVGQKAALHFSTFNQRTTPEINGVVSRVSADTTQDAKTAAIYYLVRVSMSAEEVARLGSVKLVPGMPVEVFIQTDQRTVLSYFVKPLRDQIAKAFRER